MILTPIITVPAGDQILRGSVHRDSTGRVYIPFTQSVGGGDTLLQLAYSDDEGDTWTIIEITTTPAWVPGFNAAIDSLDRIHIVYTPPGILNPANLQLAYRVFERTTGLSAEQLLTDDAFDRLIPSNQVLCVDSLDNLHLAYQSEPLGTFDRVMYRRTQAGVWQPEQTIVLNAGNVQELRGLAVGGSNVLHVVWTGFGWGANPANENVQYMFNDGAWSARIPVTDNPVDFEGATSLALETNVVHFLLFVEAPITVSYRRYEPGLGLTVLENIYNGAGNGPAYMGIDQLGELHVLTSEETLTELLSKYLKRSVPGVWQVPEVIFRGLPGPIGPVWYGAADPVLWPIAGNLRNNIPLSGYAALVWDTAVNIFYFFRSDGLVLPTPPVIVGPSVATLPATEVH